MDKSDVSQPGHVRGPRSGYGSPRQTMALAFLVAMSIYEIVGIYYVYWKLNIDDCAVEAA